MWSMKNSSVWTLVHEKHNSSLSCEVNTSLKWHKLNVHQAGGFCYWLNTPPAGMVRLRPVRLRPVRLRSVRLRPVRLRVRLVCQHFQLREKLFAAPRPHPHHKRIGADIQTETTWKHTFVSASDTF